MRRRRPLLAANWKMHFQAGDAAHYLESFLDPAPDLSARDVLFFVPATLLAEAVQAAAGRRIAVGAQNLHWEDSGAFTGEISGPMIAATGASHCLVGHSERRHLFGEDDATVARKLKAVFRSGLRPMLCVGERIEERRAGRAVDTIVTQLRSAIEELEEAALEALAIAYEPVWAIGTGETATAEIAAGMHVAIREALRERAGERAAAGMRVLYGGSVNPANIESLMEQPEIDGVLVGGASLEPESFRRIVSYGRT